MPECFHLAIHLPTLTPDAIDEAADAALDPVYDFGLDMIRRGVWRDLFVTEWRTVPTGLVAIFEVHTV
jgi:hypothetical protein